MRIFITGVEGMLGSAIAQLHVNNGDIVGGCDLYATQPTTAVCDIRNADELRSIVKAFKPDRIYHCAAMLGVENTEKYPDVCTQINTFGTRVVASLAANMDCELVFLSSSEVYGNQRGPLLESAPLLGDNVYAMSKRDGESIAVSRATRAKLTICRMFNCFGPKQVRQFFIPKIIEQAKAGARISLYGDAKNMRSYLLSHDAAKYIIDCANADRPADSVLIVNVAHPHLVTLGYAASRVVAATKSKSNIVVQSGAVYDDRLRSRDVPNRVADTTLLRSLSKHQPVDFDSAVWFVVQSFDTTKPDWTYERTVI